MKNFLTLASLMILSGASANSFYLAATCSVEACQKDPEVEHGLDCQYLNGDTVEIYTYAGTNSTRRFDAMVGLVDRKLGRQASIGNIGFDEVNVVVSQGKMIVKPKGVSSWFEFSLAAQGASKTSIGYGLSSKGKPELKLDLKCLAKEIID